MMNRKGFTLIELLIVVVIIGILAAIAIPKFASTKEKAYIASMKSDLRNLATAEEAYLSSVNPPVYMAGTWTSAAPAKDLSGAVIYAPTSGVTVTAALGATGGWSATATHLQALSRLCAIFIAPAGVVAPATVEGEPACQ